MHVIDIRRGLDTEFWQRQLIFMQFQEITVYNYNESGVIYYCVNLEMLGGVAKYIHCRTDR